MTEPEDERARRAEIDFAPVFARLGPDDLAPGSDGSCSAPLQVFLDTLRQDARTARRYVLHEVLGEGGMGVVYRAEDLDIGRPVAMKVLRSEVATARALQRFIDEVQITGQLDHPSIVPVHDVGVAEDGRPFFTMQLVRGYTLAAAMTERAAEWPSSRLLQVLLRVAQTVAFAHDRGVMHRDLKPANIMVGRFGEVLVMDWGLARLFDQEHRPPQSSSRVMPTTTIHADLAPSPERTRAGSVVGTPAYMSPEQASGIHDEIDLRADVYALGAILYHIITGRTPYADLSLTGGAVLRALAEGPPTPARLIAPGAAPELIALCEQAMRFDREERTSSASRFAKELEACLGGDPSSAETERKRRVGNAARMAPRGRRSLTGLVTLLLIALCSVILLVRRTQVLAQEVERGRVSSLRWEATELRGELASLWPDRVEALEEMRAWDRRRIELQDEAAHLLESLRAHDPQAAELPLLEALARDLERMIEQPIGSASFPDLPFVERRQRAEDLVTAGAASDEDQRRAFEVNTRRGGSDFEAGLRIPAGFAALGPDPITGLHEFAYAPTGRVPTRRARDGQLQLGSSSSVVFVLIPASQQLGGISPDPDHPLHAAVPDGQRGSYDWQVRELETDDFLIAKHELTQAQWMRLTGRRPSEWASGDLVGDYRITEMHPVESVTPVESEQVLARYGLRLPTREEWEVAARARTQTPWAFGSEPSCLLDRDNVAWDPATLGSTEGEVDTRDEWIVHAPVDRGAPNAFGLKYVHGNVAEWCVLPGTRRVQGRPSGRAFRQGGSFESHPWSAGVSAGAPALPGEFHGSTGLRPACDLVRLPREPR